jgi:hypothetical protein
LLPWIIALDNLVAIFDPATKDWDKWYPRPPTPDRDVHHFNTIATFGSHVGLVATTGVIVKYCYSIIPRWALRSSDPLACKRITSLRSTARSQPVAPQRAVSSQNQAGI